MEVFTGSGVALITPFDKDMQVDYEMLSVLIDRQIAAHTDAIIVCGTTGEPATLSAKERTAVIDFTIRHVGGRIPVIVGTGANSTSDAVLNAKEAQSLGADAILVVTPFYNKATQNGLYLHYKAVADAVSIPVIIYNVPSRTGCNILPETIARIAESCGNIAGVKEASGNISQVADLARLVGGRVAIYSGNDDQIVPILSLGGKGVISVLANVFPKETHDMVAAYREGDTKEALRLQLKYLPFIRSLFSEVNPIPVKAAMEELGFACGGLRLPLTEMEAGHRAMLAEELHRLIK